MIEEDNLNNFPEEELDYEQDYNNTLSAWRFLAAIEYGVTTVERYDEVQEFFCNEIDEARNTIEEFAENVFYGRYRKKIDEIATEINDKLETGTEKSIMKMYFFEKLESE